MYDTQDEERHAAKAALLLAKTRYNQKLARWVKGSRARLSYVEAEITTIARQCAAQMEADAVAVEKQLRVLIEDELTRFAAKVPVDPEVAEKLKNTCQKCRGQKVDGKCKCTPEKETKEVSVTDPGKDFGGGPNTTEVPEPESHGFAVTDIKATEPVLEDAPSETQDLGTETGKMGNQNLPSKGDGSGSCPKCGGALGLNKVCLKRGCDWAAEDKKDDKKSCYRCEEELDPIVAMISPVCASCSVVLSKLAAGGQPIMAPNGKPECPVCHEQFENSALFTQHQQQTKHGLDTGVPTPVAAGVRQSGPPMPPGAEQETSEPEQVALQTRPEEPTEEVDHAHETDEESDDPADIFNHTVEEMGNHQGAIKWSQPGDSDINDIAQQYGASPDDVQNSLKIIATFGDHTAVNGDLQGDQSTDSLTELDGFGGRIPTSEEKVDVDKATQVAAKKLGMTPENIQQAVRDSYGDDIGGEYFVSVAGEAHYYLPSSLVGGVENANEQDSFAPDPNAQDDPNETAQDAQRKHEQQNREYASNVLRFSSYREFLNWDRSRPSELSARG